MMGSLREDLAGPGIEVRETHISWVFLAERHVWKVKKPVSLGFLDFSTLEQRRVACEAEVRLNSRLAPEVYLGVVPVTLDSTGRHRFGGNGGNGGSDAPVDWAVYRVPPSEKDRADVWLREDRLTAPEVGRIADRIAAFHESARSDEETARFGSVEAITRNVRDNLEEARRATGTSASSTSTSSARGGM